jgi:hypothetical protein
MFTRLIALPLLVLLQANSNPDTKGIYKTQEDFAQHHLTFEAPSSSRKVLIRPHELMADPGITVVTEGQKYYFLKVELFGYRDGSKDYRFFNNESYEIIDTAGFYIYARSGFERGKGSIPVTKYYFSRKSMDSLQELTIRNLKAAFAGRNNFRYALDAQFSSDRKLLTYDNELKCYKVKYLFLTQ